MTAEEFFRQGNEYKKKGDLKNAMNCYLEAIELDPESPALEAKKMLEDIFNFTTRTLIILKNTRTMSKIKGAIVVNTDRCKGCQLCIVACPKDVIDMAQKSKCTRIYIRRTCTR